MRHHLLATASALLLLPLAVISTPSSANLTCDDVAGYVDTCCVYEIVQEQGLRVQQPAYPPIVEDCGGAFIDLPVELMDDCLLDDVTARAACTDAANADARCPSEGTYASGSDVNCEVSFAYHKIDTMILYYGGPRGDHPTSGSNHNFLSHSSDSHGLSWYIDYKSGRRLDGAKCDEAKGKWHGDGIYAALSEDSYVEYHPTTGTKMYSCETGSARGY